jgi:hypothetical protein
MNIHGVLVGTLLIVLYTCLLLELMAIYNCERQCVNIKTYSIHRNTWNGQNRKQNQIQEMAKKINKRGYKKW